MAAPEIMRYQASGLSAPIRLSAQLGQLLNQEPVPATSRATRALRFSECPNPMNMLSISLIAVLITLSVPRLVVRDAARFVLPLAAALL